MARSIPDRNKVTVVLPTLNEEKAIGPVIDELKKEGLGNILVVDGHSTDKTVDIAKSKGVEVVIQDGKGKTDAIKSCIRHLKTDYTLFMDCDFTYDPKDVDKFLEKIKDYDEVIGDRNLKNENMAKMNRFGNSVITKFLNLVISANLSDVLSGMYMFKTELLKEIELTSKGFQLEVELAAKAAENGKIIQIPINYRGRMGDSNVSPFQEGWNNMRDILKFSYSYNPTILFSILSGLIMIPGIILVGYVGIEWVLGSWHAGILQIGILLLVVGSNAVAFTFISIIIRRIERKVNLTIRKLERSLKQRDES